MRPTNLILRTAALAVLFSPPLAHATGMNVGGTFTGSCAQQDPHPLDAPDHVVVAQICKAKNAGAPFDGDDVAFSQIVVLDKGNGSQIGELVILDGKGALVSEYRGTIKTTIVDGQPRTTSAGTYKTILGTGAFAGGTGHGTYDVTFTSPTDFVSHWKGVFEMPKRVGSR